MEGDGTHPQRLTTMADGEAFPTWSPDRARLAFIRGEQTVIIRDLSTGSETIRYTLSGMPHIYAVEWSPDSLDLMIYVGAPGLSEWRIVHVDTGDAQTVPGSFLSCASAIWAPMRIK